MTIRPNGRFAQLNVGDTRNHILVAARYLSFVHDPKAVRPPHEADLSHSLIGGLPPGDSPEAMLVADMITECIQELHPAVA